MFEQNSQDARVKKEIDRTVDEGPGAGHVGRDSGLIEENLQKEEGIRHQRMREIQETDVNTEGRSRYWMDVDRMVNEGLGTGRVGPETGRIEESVELMEEKPPRETE